MADPDVPFKFRVALRRASKLPVWADVLLRLSLAFFLILVVIVIHWFDREGLKDSHDGVISFLDVVYFTMISITTQTSDCQRKMVLVRGMTPPGT